MPGIICPEERARPDLDQREDRVKRCRASLKVLTCGMQNWVRCLGAGFHGHCFECKAMGMPPKVWALGDHATQPTEGIGEV